MTDEQDHDDQHDDREDKHDRPTIDVVVVGGWPDPWPNVAELALALPADKWTLVGGLMTQLHSIHHGFGIVRATNDVDVVIHIETSRGVPAKTAAALESIGYRLQDSFDPRNNTAHRFVRGTSRVDLVAGAADEEIVDVLVADHPAPRVIEQLRGRDMVQIEGGTQALRRTVNARLEITPGAPTIISVPRPLGAVILKSAAYTTDSRDPDRHLSDAAALLGCVDNPFVERENLVGSDRKRLAVLDAALPLDHPAWRALPEAVAFDGQIALRILCSPRPSPP
ncbi:MAG: Nucleotidyl transferase AbiEii toxin, Type system [Nocardioides sp.]|nr:Nucleotidyl transferase AbiEii toxin, Type system [Nocardioides sp.]